LPHALPYMGAQETHAPPWHASVLTQSLSTAQLLPVAQGAQLPPPQSTSVSFPSLSMFVHCPMHVWSGVHVLFGEQSPSAMHATQTAPVHTLPPEFMHMEPSGATFVKH